jgi:HPt (histidine-containing phosphotransfer) domain-containing protein
LGKTQLQEAAASLEQSLQIEPVGYTPEQLDAIKNELEKTLLEYEPLLKEAENKKPETTEINNDELSALLSELEQLLVKGDFGAAAYAERLQGIAGMEELAERIDGYDFEGALEIIRTFM